jgi:hypothetical protein
MQMGTIQALTAVAVMTLVTVGMPVKELEKFGPVVVQAAGPWAFVPEMYGYAGRDVEYFEKKYGIIMDAPGVEYAVQWPLLSPEQQAEAKRLGELYPPGTHINDIPWKDQALYYCYKYRDVPVTYVEGADSGEFVPETYDSSDGRDVKYFNEKYGTSCKDAFEVYAWQWQQFSPEQQAEAERLAGEQLQGATLKKDKLALVLSYALREYPSAPYTVVRSGEFVPETCDAEAGRNLRYFMDKHGIYLKNEEELYAWQWQQLSAEQQQEIKWLADLKLSGADLSSLSAAEQALYRCYSHSGRKRTDLTVHERDPFSVPVPKTGGPYAAVHKQVANGGDSGEIIGWLTEKEVHDKIMALEPQYPTGSIWGNDEGGCSGFVRMVWRTVLSDNTLEDFWNTLPPPTKHNDLTQIKVGDEWWSGDSGGGEHTVIVTEVTDNSIIVAEGNVGFGDGRTRWNREITFDYILNTDHWWFINTYYAPLYRYDLAKD